MIRRSVFFCSVRFVVVVIVVIVVIVVVAIVVLVVVRGVSYVALVSYGPGLQL